MRIDKIGHSGPFSEGATLVFNHSWPLAISQGVIVFISADHVAVDKNSLEIRLPPAGKPNDSLVNFLPLCGCSGDVGRGL